MSPSPAASPLTLVALAGEELSVALGALELRGHPACEQLVVRPRDGGGHAIEVARLTVRELRARWGPIAITAAELRAEQVLVELDASGQLHAARSATLEADQLGYRQGTLELSVDGCGVAGGIALAPTTCSANELTATGARVDGEGWVLEGAAHLHQLQLDWSAGLALQLAAARLRQLSWRHGALRIAASTARAAQLALRHGAAGLAVDVDTLTAAELGCEEGTLGLDARAASCELASGLHLDGGSWSAPSVLLAGTTVAAERPLSRQGQPPRAGTAATLRDWDFLDALHGQLNVDLHVDVSVPVIGRRQATHSFRVPLSAGTLDYKQVEKSLCGLEDAVLDLEIVGDALVLEKDLPLVPFDNKPIVVWPLDEPAQRLAAHRRVHLRTLLGGRLAESTAADPQTRLQLHRVDLRDLHVGLEVKSRATVALVDAPAPAGQADDAAPWLELVLGPDERPGVVGLVLGGAVRYCPAEPPAPTELVLAAEQLLTSLRIALPGRLLTADLLELTVERLAVALEGLAPGRVEGALPRIVLGGLGFGPGADAESR